MQRSKGWQSGMWSLVLLITAGLFLYFFAQLPFEGTSLGLDWRSIMGGVNRGNLDYTKPFRNPPWSILPLIPLSFLPFRLSWGMIILITAGVLAFSVPRKVNTKLWLLGVVLLVTSYSSMRHFADGNLEAWVIGGTLLLLHGYRKQDPVTLALGGFLVTAKMQLAWLLLATLAYLILRTWPFKKTLVALWIVLAAVIPSMIWKGGEWLQAVFGIPQRGSLMDTSLIASLTRLGFAPWLVWLAWGFLLGLAGWLGLRGATSLSRLKAGFLLAASLLLAPYAAGNSLLSILAIGIIPLFFSNRWPGVLLLLIFDLPYLFNGWLRYHYGAIYGTGVALAACITLGWFVWIEAGQQPEKKAQAV